MLRIRRQALHNLHKAQKRQKTYYDKLHSADKLSYKVGTLVLVKNSKKVTKKGSRMEQNWSGPVYSIIEVLQKGTFRLARQDNLSKPLAQKYNMARLKLYHQRDDATTVNGVDNTENKGELIRDDATINGVDGTENKGELLRDDDTTENKGELLRDDATVNGVDGTENKGELLRDDDTINGVNGTSENKGELLGDDATTIGDDYTSELWTDDATINVVSDRPSSNTSNCNTDKLPNDNWPSPSCEIITEEVFPFVEYQPVCQEWQRDRCCQLGLKLHHGNHRHSNKPSCIGITQAPKMTTRIKGDGNCFFRAISQVLTGSQEDHQEVRALVTSYMLENATSNKMVSALLGSMTTMMQYLKKTKMCNLSVWATEMEIIATASMLHTTIYVYSPSGATNKWLRHQPEVAFNDTHHNEAIYITNINSHFETVKCM